MCDTAIHHDTCTTTEAIIIPLFIFPKFVVGTEDVGTRWDQTAKW